MSISNSISSNKSQDIFGTAKSNRLSQIKECGLKSQVILI